MKCVTKGSASLVFPMAIAVPRVPRIATSLRMKSKMDTPLFMPPLGVELFPSPSSTAPALIFAWKQ